MKRSLLFPAVMALIAAAICIVSPSAAHAQRRPQTGGGKSNGPFYVIKILNPPEDSPNGPVGARGGSYNNYTVADSSEIKTKQEELDRKYKELLDQWDDKRKIDSTTPRPLKPIVKKMKTFKTRPIAEEYAKKLNDEEEEKKAGDKPKQP